MYRLNRARGVPEVLDAIIKLVPPPSLVNNKIAARSLIFDSRYDDYRGVVAAIRVFEGVLTVGQKYKLLGSGATGEILEVGKFVPQAKIVPLTFGWRNWLCGYGP